MSNDMAILICFFNPTKSKRMLMNYLYMVNLLKLQNLPFFTIELVFNEEPQEIDDAVHVNSKSYMFHKERLYRILEERIPEKYTKLAFLDADVYFDKVSWYNESSLLLNTYEVVQPFEHAIWLTLNYRGMIIRKQSWLKMCTEAFKSLHLYHPGYAWCMQRTWYKKVGFYDEAVTNGGDLFSALHWSNIKTPPNTGHLVNSFKKSYSEYCKLERPKMTYLKNITLYHLYHGSRDKRRYLSIFDILKDEKKDIDQLIYKNNDGVYEWNDKSISDKFLEYFISRDDDGI